MKWKYINKPIIFNMKKKFLNSSNKFIIIYIHLKKYIIRNITSYDNGNIYKDKKFYFNLFLIKNS